MPDTVRARIVLLTVLLIPGSALAVTGVTVCSVLDTPGETYVLANDLSGATTSAAPFSGMACVKITASDVTLDCAGHTITNDGTGGDTYGILTTGPLHDITITNCAGISRYTLGVQAYLTDDSVIADSNAFDNVIGFFLYSSSRSTLTNNHAANPSIDFYVNAGAGNSLISNSGRAFSLYASSSNVLRDNLGTSFSLRGSSGNELTSNEVPTGNNGFFVGDGFALSDSSNNVLANNSAAHANIGFSILGSSGNTLAGNTASKNIHGFRLAGTSTGNAFLDNHAVDNSANGFLVFNGFVSSFTNNVVSGNGGDGFQLAGGAFNSFTGNSVSGNSANGFFISGSTAIDLFQNAIFDNAGSGVYATSFNTHLSHDHLYHNDPDLRVEILSSAPGAPALTLASEVFDEPSGSLAHSTVLSMSDGGPAAYAMRWSAPPAALPAGFASFAGKFIGIAPLLGRETPIDSLTWSWLDTEAGAAGEAGFDVWRYQNGWSEMNAALDTAANTLSLAGVIPRGVFAILAPDEDSDGVFDAVDLCPGSVADPVVQLNPHHYAQVVDFGAFEVGPSQDESVVYTQEVTKGCTCAQIVDGLADGKGTLKRGCDRDLMEAWTGVSAQPDWDAGLGN
jgi:parallel beta-helix repeat protein